MLKLLSRDRFGFTLDTYIFIFFPLLQEGLVEIREEYVEESEKKAPGSGTKLHFHLLPHHPLDDSTENIKL